MDMPSFRAYSREVYDRETVATGVPRGEDVMMPGLSDAADDALDGGSGTSSPRMSGEAEVI